MLKFVQESAGHPVYLSLRSCKIVYFPLHKLAINTRWIFSLFFKNAYIYYKGVKQYKISDIQKHTELEVKRE